MILNSKTNSHDTQSYNSINWPCPGHYFCHWTDRICKAAAEVKMPVLMRIDHADQAGIDFMDFGGQDLGHDISIQKHPGFESLEDCRKFVKNAPKGTSMFFK